MTGEQDDGRVPTGRIKKGERSERGVRAHPCAATGDRRGRGGVAVARSRLRDSGLTGHVVLRAGDRRMSSVRVLECNAWHRFPFPSRRRPTLKRVRRGIRVQKESGDESPHPLKELSRLGLAAGGPTGHHAPPVNNASTRANL
jgi:hypothetical protein